MSYLMGFQVCLWSVLARLGSQIAHSFLFKLWAGFAIVGGKTDHVSFPLLVALHAWLARLTLSPAWPLTHQAIIIANSWFQQKKTNMIKESLLDGSIFGPYSLSMFWNKSSSPQGSLDIADLHICSPWWSFLFVSRFLSCHIRLLER